MIFYNTYIALERRLPIVTHITRSQLYDIFIRANDAILFKIQHHFLTHQRILVKYKQIGKLSIICPECYTILDQTDTFIKPGDQMTTQDHFLLLESLIYSVIEISAVWRDDCERQLFSWYSRDECPKC